MPPGSRSPRASAARTRRATWFNGTSYSHDADGNRTFQYPGNGAAVQYRWSATGELTTVLRSLNWAVQDSTTFTYDGFGRRITKTSTVTGAHEYLVDGDNLLAELDAAGVIRTEYTSYPGIDTPHSVLVASTGQLPGEKLSSLIDRCRQFAHDPYILDNTK